MSEQAQITIARWEQRLLRGKLHLPRLTGGDSGVESLGVVPLCGRQLNNHRRERSQLADKIELAESLEEFTYQLTGGKACRHCAVDAGLLVRTQQVREESEDCSDEENDQ
jgi:hypothetical protein